MYAERRAQISLYEGLRSIFEDATIWPQPFTVLGRQDWGPDFQGTWPWVFIVNGDPAPNFQLKHLPVIVVDTMLDIKQLELGGGRFGTLRFALNVFAPNGAVRDDICGAIMAHQSNVIIRDYDQAPPPILESHYLVPNVEGDIWSQSSISHSPFAPEWYSAYTRYGRVLSSAFELINL